MKKLALILALILSLTMISIPTLADDAELTPVHVLTERFRSGYFDIEWIDQSLTYQAFNEMLKEKGIKIEFEAVANEQYETVTRTRLASGTDLPDLMRADFSEAELVGYGMDGTFIDVLQAINEYDEDGSILSFINDYYPTAIGRITADGGGVYWIPSMTATRLTGELSLVDTYPGNRMMICVRKDWMDKIGVEYKNEAMTMEDLHQMLLAFRDQDANGNGVADEIVNVDISSFGNGFAQMYGLPFDLATLNSSTDEFESPWYKKEALADYVTFMHQLIEEGLYDTSVIGNAGVGDTLIAENKVSAIWTYLVETWVEGANAAQYPDMLYLPVLPLTDYTPVIEARDIGTTLANRFVIPSASDNVEAVVKLLDVIYTPEVDMMNCYGLKDVGYEIDEEGNIVRLISYGADFQNFPEKNGGALEWCTYGIPATRSTLMTEKKWAESISALPFKSEFNTWLFTEGKDLHQMQLNGSNFYAVASTEEIEKLNEIETTLKTFSTETITQLILGNYDLADLDSYVEQLQALGLDDYIGVLAARHERFLAAEG